MKFDIDAARKEGYSDEEIADYLASKRNFDLSGALESGYSVREVIDHLNKPAPEPRAEPPVETGPSQRQDATATSRPEQRGQTGGRATAPATRSQAAADSAAAVDYGDAATAMQGSAPPPTAPPAQSRGLIQRVADALKPERRSVLEDNRPTAQQNQAELNRRLSYGAGPISRETAAAADAVRSGASKTTDQTVKKVARAMDSQDTPSLADITARARSPENQRAAREAKANEFRTAGEWAVDTLSSLAQGTVGLVQLPVNIIAPGSGTAKILRETQKELQGAESEVLQANRERLKERVLSEGGFFDKYVATVKELVTNPTLTISEAAKQLPNFLGVVGAARLVGAGAAGTVAVAGRASPTVALGEAISGGAMQTAARAAGTTAGGAGASMVMAGGDAAGNVYETLTDRKKTPLSVWRQNTDFQRLVSEGKSEKQAIEELATTKARMAALITAPLGLLGYMGAEAAIAGRGLGRATAQALTPSGMGRIAAKDVLGEQIEEGGTQAGGNLISQTVNPNQSITEGVPEAMGTALVTSAPFTAAGLVSRYQEATSQANADLAAERNAAYVLDPNNYDPTLMAPTAATRRASDVGPSAPARVVNFTEPDSATAQAGLTPIVVPVPTRQETTDVGTAGIAGPAIAGGGQFSSDLGGTSLGTAGLAGVDTLRGGGAGTAGLAPVVGEAAPLGAGAGQQPTTVGLPRPLARATDADLLARAEAAVASQAGLDESGQPKPWAGRANNGYLTEEAAQQGMATASAVLNTKETHDWRVEPMGDGKFHLVPYPKETTLGTQATQAQQAEAQRQPIAGAQGIGLGVPLAAGGVMATGDGGEIGQRGLEIQPGSGPAEVGALTTPEGSQAAGLTAPLRLAAPVPLRRAGDAIMKFNRDTGLNIELSRDPLTPQQQASSAIARLLGLNLSVVKGDPGALPNGFVIPDIGKKDVYVAADADDAPLSVVIHEGYHLLPDDLKARVKGAIGTIFREEKRDQFATQFDYDKGNKDLVDEEIGAFLSQAVSRRQDFLEKLQQQLGDKDFIAVVGTILGKLKEVVTGAKKEYGENFLNEYVKDIPAAVDLLSGVYAEAMNRQNQGQQAGSLAASNRSRIGMDLKDVIKRTPELQEGMAKLQAGEITKEDYDRLVNEYKPVEPYKAVPAPVTPEAARFALANGRGQSKEKAAKFGLPSQEMRAGEPTQLRLDIPSYSEHGAWVVSVHRPEGRSFGAGKVVGYEPVASVNNAEFGMLEKSAAKIAAGANKGTIATIMGDWRPTTAAEAKIKADQALKSKEWVQVGMDPERHSYFYDRATMEPVTAAEEALQIGPLVLAKNPTYGKKSDFMFSNRTQEPAIGAKLRKRIDSDYEGALQEYSQLKGTKDGRVLDADIARELSPEYRADRSRAPEVHEAVSDFIQRTFERRMAKPSRGDIVAFMAGGGGAGKSSAEELLAPILDRATTVLDGTLSTYENSERNVQMALDSGRRVAIAYVYRDPVDALVNGVLTRAKSTGRTVPIDALVKGHAGSSSVVRKLQQKFGENRNFKLYVVDNLRGMNNAKRVKSIEKITPVILDGLKERLINATEQQLQAGQIDDKLYRATVGRQADGGAGAQGAARVGEIQQGSGVDAGQGRQLGESQDQVIQYSKRAGQYTYEIDAKKRLIVSGDIDRIRFVAKSVATGTLNADKNAVVFKSADASAVIKTLKNEQKADPEIAKAVAVQLGLNEEELSSTSLEFQTGEPGERAFSAPLQGGIPETVQFLEGRRRSSGLRLLDISNPEDQDTLAKLIAAETMAAIRSSGNALEWYDETIAKTLAMAAVKYPELADDRNAQMVFRLAMAITSQGLNVENNLKITMRQYDAFRSSSSNPADRRFPEVGEGDSSQAMVGNFKLANELLADMGQDLFRRFLVTEFTIGELNSAGFEPGGELVDESVLGSSVFGPKIGFGFYSNLNGNFEPVTMDMWFMRTIGRLTGNLRSFDAEKFSGQLQRFRDSFDKSGADGVYADQFDADLVGRASTSEDSAIELARQVKKAHKKDYKANREAFDSKERKKTNLVLAAETMIQSVDKPKDVPGNGTERRQLREVVRKAVAEVERVYGQRIPPAAMQALIWYPEQELYKALGVKLSVTSQDYAGATEKVLTQEGYDAKRLRTAAQSGARRVRQANGRDVGRGAQGDGQEARRAGPLQDTEREQFIRSRYERAQLEQERLTPKRKGVIFEVAPDPNNTELTTRWRNLSQEQRLAVSDRIAQEIVPKVLAQMGTSGIIVSQVGSYLDDTNPSFEVLLDKGNALEVAKALGFILSQDSMMVISPKDFDGGSKVGAIAIEIGDKSQSEVDAIYQSLREIEVKGEKPIGGQSTANGVMTILNYSSVPTNELAILVDQKLNKGYSILTREVFAAFPEKQEYDYASEANDGRGSRADLRRGARALRSEATAALERELAGVTIRRSNRLAEPARGPGARTDAANDGQNVTGIHYGKAPGLSRLSGAQFGSGIKGAEQARLNEPGVDPRIKKRVYFYLTSNNADMPRPEIGLGSHVYRATLGNMYDPTKASAGAAKRVRDLMQGSGANAFESAVLDAGYRGYVNREQGTAVVLNADVPVAYEGMADAGKMRDRVIERIAPKSATRQEGGELVRRPVGDEMVGIIKARPALAEAAPSFRLEFGEARVKQTEAESADAALAEAGSSFQFGKQDADSPFTVMRANRQRVVGSQFVMDSSDRMDLARVKLQDDALRMKRVIEAVKSQGGTVSEAQNFYDANTLMPGRIQAAIDDFKTNIVKPMLDQAAEYGIDMDELSMYAYAKHAKERNAYIAGINKRMPDGGSGMTDAEADNILQLVSLSGDQAKFDDLHQRLMAITANTRQVMLSEGLITQDEFDAMTNAYQDYIPLRGFENVDEETGVSRPGVGRGVNIRGAETVRAMGRKSKAGDLIENVIRDYERVISRVEKNDVGKVLLDFVLSNPDPDLWGVDVERTKPAFNKAQGTVQYTKAIDKGEDTIGVKVGGQQVYIKLADKELARALRQAWKDETSGLERATLAMTGWWNNWLRAVLTKYNPAFAAINIPRDALWSGTASALDDLGAKGLGLYLKNYGKAFMASARQELGVSGTNNAIFGNPQVDRMFQEFRNSGGITGGFYMRTLEDINKDLRNELLLSGASARNPWESIKSMPPFKLARLTLRVLEFMGAASENATRFALYMTSREMGNSTTKAAVLAKDGTTNFNRKGEWGGALNNLYLFFNAGVQGTAQLAKVMKNPKVQAAMAGVSGVGMMLALYGAASGGEDDDGEAYWDKIPSYVKERNLVIMLPPGGPLAAGIERVGQRGRYITIPVQYGFNIFPNLGYMMADVLRNAEDERRGVTPTKAALHMTSVVFGSVNPFGGSVDVTDGVQVLLAAAPTLVDLPIQIVTERNTFGSPSAPAKSPWDKRPDSERMFTSQQGTTSAKIAQALNELGGGNEAKTGKILGVETSVAPGTIQTLIAATTGGLGTFAEQVGTSVMAMSGDGNDLRANKIPFVNRFYGEVDESANIRTASERMAEVRKLADEVKAQQKVGIDPELSNDENKLLELAKMQEIYQKAQSRMRKNELQIIKDPEMTEAQKKLERQRIQVERDKLATEMNREYLRAMKKEEGRRPP